MEDTLHEGSSVAVYQTVRCLECGAVYVKPARGGTARSNPGCPECGYVGWIATGATVMPEKANATRRSDADRRLGRSAQSR